MRRVLSNEPQRGHGFLWERSQFGTSSGISALQSVQNQVPVISFVLLPLNAERVPTMANRKEFELPDEAEKGTSLMIGTDPLFSFAFTVLFVATLPAARCPSRPYLPNGSLSRAACSLACGAAYSALDLGDCRTVGLSAMFVDTLILPRFFRHSRSPRTVRRQVEDLVGGCYQRSR